MTAKRNPQRKAVSPNGEPSARTVRRATEKQQGSVQNRVPGQNEIGLRWNIAKESLNGSPAMLMLKMAINLVMNTGNAEEQVLANQTDDFIRGCLSVLQQKQDKAKAEESKAAAAVEAAAKARGSKLIGREHQHRLPTELPNTMRWGDRLGRGH